MDTEYDSEKASHQTLRNGVFGVAIVAGLGSAVLKVWDRFFQNMKERAPIEVLRQTRNEAQDALLSEAKISGMSTAEYVRRNHGYEQDFQKGFNGFLKDAVGIESTGWGIIKGSAQRFHSLGNYTKAQIVFGTVFSTAATVGGFILLNQNADMKHALRRSQQQLAKQTAASETTRS